MAKEYLDKDGLQYFWQKIKAYIDSHAGGGAVSSVNGKTGTVVLDASDVGALPDSTSIPSPSDANPQMDGTATAGTSNTYARGNHKHPTDTSRAPINDPVFTTQVTSPSFKVTGHNSDIGTRLTQTDNKAGTSFTVGTTWEDIAVLTGIGAGTWIIKGWVSFNGSSAGTRRIYLTTDADGTADASTGNFSTYAPANTQVLVSGCVLVKLTESTTYYLKVKTNAGSPVGRYSAIHAIRIA